MQFSSFDFPNSALSFFKTVYPPEMINNAFHRKFTVSNPLAAADPFDVVQVHPSDHRYDVPVPGHLDATSIMLGWPEDGPYYSIDPGAIAPSVQFSGRSNTCFRERLQSLDANGAVSWHPESWMITYECRPLPQYPPEYQEWLGHGQQDVNHFTACYQGQFLFWDTGDGQFAHSPWWTSAGHSLPEVKIGGAAFHGFIMGQDIPRTGWPFRSVFGKDDAPSIAGGDWLTGLANPHNCYGTDVTEGRRHLLVVPRPGYGAPYLVLFDELDLSGSGKVREVMQSSVPASAGLPDSVVHFSGQRAWWRKGPAMAVVRAVAPSGMSLDTV